MATILQKVDFAQKYWRDKSGRPFDLSPPERRWVIDEYWRALDGYKYWPAVDLADIDYDDPISPQLCSTAAELVGKLVEWDWSLIVSIEGDRYYTHPQHDRCPGLLLEAQLFVWQNIPRREGKTFNFWGYAGATVFHDYHAAITYVAGSEDQTDQLFEENFKKVVLDTPELRRAARFVGHKCYVDSRSSFIELVPTTHRSVTGRGRTLVGFDESRDIPARAMMALTPSTWAENGIACPKGHVHGPRAKLNGSLRCPVPGCGERLIPWYGRCLFASSSGIEGENSEYDWFGEGIDHLREKPDKNHHCHKRDESWNPSVHAGSKTATERVFGQLESTKDYVAVEVHNERRRKGEVFLRKDQLESAWDRALKSLDAYARPAIGFLDTSQTKELTSLVCVGDDSREYESKWSRIVMVHLTIWEPKKQAVKLISEETVLPFFDAFMPRWPQLKLWVDTRVRPWAERFVKLVKVDTKNRPWGRRVERFQGQREERDAGYDTLEELVIGHRARLIPDRTLRKEFDAARNKRDSKGKIEVREHKRWITHLDVLDGLAACCYFVYLEQLKTGVGLGEINAAARRPPTREAVELDEQRRQPRGGSVFAMITKLYREDRNSQQPLIDGDE